LLHTCAIFKTTKQQGEQGQMHCNSRTNCCRVTGQKGATTEITLCMAQQHPYPRLGLRVAPIFGGPYKKNIAVIRDAPFGNGLQGKQKKITFPKSNQKIDHEKIYLFWVVHLCFLTM